MRQTCLVMSVCLIANVLHAQTREPAAMPTKEAGLAAESLRRSAMALRAQPSSPGWAVRLVALTRYAEQLDPNNPTTAWLLGQIYEIQNRNADAAEQFAIYLKAQPQDYQIGRRWLALAISTQQTADQRLKFFADVEARKDLSASVRALAAVERAQTLQGMGESAKARQAVADALVLDPICPEAVKLHLEMMENPTPVDQVDASLKILRATTGSPAAVQVAGGLASQLNAMGLAQESLKFYHYGWTLGQRLNEDNPPYLLMLGYFSAMLDSAVGDPNRAGRAAEQFAPLLKKFPQSADLEALLIEAYRQTGQTKKADDLAKLMGAAYQTRMHIENKDAVLLAEIAWYHLVTSPNYKEALSYARQAAQMDATNPLVQRVLGAAELQFPEESDEGIARLRALLDTDPYAAVFLARYYYDRRNDSAGEKVLLAGLKLGRDGAAYRSLAALAREHGVAVAPIEYSKAVAERVKKFNVHVLDVALQPGQNILVELHPTADTPVGEPVYIEAVLTNRSKLPIPLGESGLLSPTLLPEVTTTPVGEQKKYTELPLITWPAPRFLEPGQSVTSRGRLDVGPLNAFLCNQPFEKISLTVSGTLDPVQDNGSSHSRLPDVPVNDVMTSRLAIYRSVQPPTEATVAGYKRMLGLIVRDMRYGTTSQKMVAAHRVASLLAIARRVELSKAAPPKALGRDFTKPVLLAMMNAILQDKEAVVRAEMIAAMQNVMLDSTMVKLLAPTLRDPSPLVRFRLAELLGVQGDRTHQPVLQFLTKDPNPLVRLMASAFVTEKKE